MVRTMLCLCMLLVALDASAEKTAFACQTVKVGGLEWKNSRWNLQAYSGSKFVLVLDGDRLTSESAAKAVELPSGITCAPGYRELYVCHGELGTSLIFNGATMEGAYAQTFGAVSVNPDGTRDSLGVAAFTCSKF